MSSLWIDVGDLFSYAGVFKRPSGIQRVVYELGQALAGTPGIGFVRATANGFAPVGWSSIAALFAALSDETELPPPPPPPGSPFKRAWRLQWDACRALVAVPGSFWPRDTGPARQANPGKDAAGDGATVMRPGDTLLIAGAGWADPTHASRVTVAHRHGGIRVALLVHDIIPLRRPEWFDPGTVSRFRGWFDTMLAISARLLAVSDSTARDVLAYRDTRHLPGPAAMTTIRLGDGFTPPPSKAATGSIVPPTRPMALYVSTIEARKNHVLLVDVWRELLHRLGPDAVPDLVFAGREGGLTGDLMRQLRANDCLGGKIILHHAASDADIAALYQASRFTLFPSLYEGWGLPVAESLAFGKPCLAANSSSIPEVGGRLARYFDPLDMGDATRAVEAVLSNPTDLAAWRDQIVAHFRPTRWSRTAEMVLAGVA